MFQPAIEVAERGTPVNETIDMAYRMRANDLARLPDTAALLRFAAYGAGHQPAHRTVLPASRELLAAEVPALVALEHEDGHGVLLDTLTAFFDNAGNIARVADALTIHRATLYQRLKRIEQITGCALDNGDDRLMLHLGLKLRALAAAHRERVGGDPSR